MPVDAEPSSKGTFWLDEDGGRVLAYYTPKGNTPDLHTSHFATCPEAKAWKRNG